MRSYESGSSPRRSGAGPRSRRTSGGMRGSAAADRSCFEVATGGISPPSRGLLITVRSTNTAISKQALMAKNYAPQALLRDMVERRLIQGNFDEAAELALRVLSYEK